MNNLEKLISNLSTYWGISPEKVVDRLNGMKESEIKNVVNKMTKKFKNGGLIDCLRNGGKYTECKACGGRVEKGQDGLVTDKHPYYRPNVLQSIFGAFSKNPQYPRYDGNGTYSGQVRPNGVQELEVKGPYGSYMQYTYPNGKIIIEDTRNGGVRYDHPESTKNSPFRKTAPADLVEMFQNVGARFYQDGGYLKAKGYHNKYSDKDTVTKIQNFLVSRGYDIGNAGIDGIYGKDTYNAIRKYQQDNGLTADGMWGEDTNSIHRVLNATNAPYRNDTSGRSGAHRGSEPGRNVSGLQSGKVSYTDMSNAEAKAIANPEWFWGDSEDARRWRNIFGSKGGEQLMTHIYENTPDEIRQRIDYKKLPSYLAQHQMNSGITNATNQAAETIAKTAAAGSLPLSAISAPVLTAGAVAGSTGLGLIGRSIGSNLGYGDTLGSTQTQLSRQQAPVARPAENVYGDIGQIIGSSIGAVGGAAGSRYIGKPSLQGLSTPQNTPTVDVKPKFDLSRWLMENTNYPNELYYKCGGKVKK